MPSGTLNAPTVNSSGLITAQIGTSGYLASGTKTTKQLTTQAVVILNLEVVAVLAQITVKHIILHQLVTQLVLMEPGP